MLTVVETAKPDIEVAAELRKEFLEKIEPILEVLERANRHNMLITFRVGVTQYGRMAVTELEIARHF